MADKDESLWRQIRGNAKWQAILWISSYLLSATTLATIQSWLHKPASTLDIAFITAVPFLIVLVISLYRAFKTPPLIIRVQNTSGPVASIFLKITNLGTSTTFAAFGQITSHLNGANPFRSGKFQFGWDDGKVSRRPIPKDETASLAIPSFGHVIENDLLEIKLWEVVSGVEVPWESFRWNATPPNSSRLMI